MKTFLFVLLIIFLPSIASAQVRGVVGDLSRSAAFGVEFSTILVDAPCSNTGVLVGGTDVSARDTGELRRSLGYVQQDAGLLPHWSVLRNVAMANA